MMNRKHIQDVSDLLEDSDPLSQKHLLCQQLALPRYGLRDQKSL